MQTTIATPMTKRRSRVKSVAAKIVIVTLPILLSAAATVPFYFMGQPEDNGSRWRVRMPDTHDMFLHWDQMKSFYKGLHAGESYPRWEEETNRGFGAPTTSYYPPGVYYLTSAVYVVVRDWLRTLLWTHLLMMAASAAAIYLYARRSMSRIPALVAMAAYVFLPFHLIDQYQRGAMAELLSFVWMPLIMLFAEQLFGAGRAAVENQENDSLVQENRGSRLTRPASIMLAIAGLAASYGAFLWSHPPTAYQFSMVVAIFLPLLALFRRNWKGLLFSGFGLALGLALSAAYLLPAAREQELIRHEFVSQNWPYHESYVFLHTEYIEANWGFFNLINHTWLFNTAVIVVGLFAALVFTQRFRDRARSPRSNAILWGVLGCFASFMMTSASYPIGARLPKIDIGVFSWRMLSITTLMAALLAGVCAQAAIEAHRQSKKLSSRALGAVAAVVMLGTLVFTGFEVASPIWSAPLFEPEAEHLNLAIIPRTAPDDPEDLPDVEPVELDEENGSVRVERWDPQHREIAVQLEDADQVWIRTFNFPGWTATVDGSPARIETGEDLGDITIDLEAGSHKIVLDYLETPVRRRGRIITTSTFLLLIGSVLIGFAMLGSAALSQRKHRDYNSLGPAKN